MSELLQMAPGERFPDPPRYQLGALYGTKTAVGVYKTIMRLWEENRMDINQSIENPTVIDLVNLL